MRRCTPSPLFAARTDESGARPLTRQPSRAPEVDKQSAVSPFAVVCFKCPTTGDGVNFYLFSPVSFNSTLLCLFLLLVTQRAHIPAHFICLVTSPHFNSLDWCSLTDVQPANNPCTNSAGKHAPFFVFSLLNYFSFPLYSNFQSKPFLHFGLCQQPWTGFKQFGRSNFAVFHSPFFDSQSTQQPHIISTMSSSFSNRAQCLWRTVLGAALLPTLFLHLHLLLLITTPQLTAAQLSENCKWSHFNSFIHCYKYLFQ